MAMGVAGRGMDLVDARLTYAEHVARVHCPISWPEGEHSLNCYRLVFRAPFYGWAFGVLVNAGWNVSQIDTLDARTGAWL
jgi:hypothetical protein